MPTALRSTSLAPSPTAESAIAARAPAGRSWPPLARTYFACTARCAARNGAARATAGAVRFASSAAVTRSKTIANRSWGSPYLRPFGAARNGPVTGSRNGHSRC